MNYYLEKGLFMVCYAGIIHLVDSLTVKQGSLSFGGLWTGAIVLVVVGIVLQFTQGDRRGT